MATFASHMEQIMAKSPASAIVLDEPVAIPALQPAPVYSILCKTGRMVNGAEGGHGVIYHAVPAGQWKAVCGTEPGRRADWSSYPGQTVTCPRCLKKIGGGNG